MVSPPRPLIGEPLGTAGDSFISDEILRYDASTGAFIGPLVRQGSGGLSGPEAMLIGPDGKLYVGSFFTNASCATMPRRVAFVDTFVTPDSGGLYVPHKFLFGPDGNLYVTSRGTSNVVAVRRSDRRVQRHLHSPRAAAD